MSRILIISGHPDLQQSWTNRLIIDTLEQEVSDLNVRRLDQRYPDFNIDVASEQQALLDAEIVVLQFPFYWYSVPALLKQWIDKVFTFNFAYGPEGDKLKGKQFLLSVTVGGPQEAYQPLGYNHFTIEQLLRPLQQTAYLAGMIFQPPLISHRMVYIPGVYNTQEEVEARAREHTTRLISTLDSLRAAG